MGTADQTLLGRKGDLSSRGCIMKGTVLYLITFLSRLTIGTTLSLAPLGRRRKKRKRSQWELHCNAKEENLPAPPFAHLHSFLNNPSQVSLPCQV